MTYGELEEVTSQLARTLLDRGCTAGDRVCLLLPKSTEAIVGILGILKANCVYVPLDPACPAARLAKIIDTCAPRWILAGGGTGALLDELPRLLGPGSSVPAAWLDESTAPVEVGFTWSDLARSAGGPVRSVGSASDPAYIMFTSGSTGNPKGVVITHANVIHFVEWALSYFEMGEGERVSCHSPLHFDLSVFDIFGAFAAGAELHLVPPDLNVLPNKMAAFIRESELTQWFSVPSALTYMSKFDVVRQGDFPSLKRLLWCGEVLPVPALTYWMRRLPHVTFTNLYGPTEATIASAYFTVPEPPADPRAQIPIGRACGGENLLVLDDELRATAPGASGNLYIEGVGLSPGYYRDSGKTAEVFVESEARRLYKTGDLAKVGEDGLVYFLGRADTQIKSRGHRIELGEVAAALNAVDALRESAAFAVPTTGFEGAVICCAYVVQPDRSLNPAGLRSELSKMLPAYMLPTRWIEMQELPKNANGKIDTRRLKEQLERIS